MSDPFIGAITIFAGTFAPVGWVFCDGSLLSVNNNQALFTLLGTTYGGDGQSTFGVPDLRGRLPVGMGNGGGLTPRTLGQAGGQESVTLTSVQIPAHPHTVVASTAQATTQTPGSGVLYGTVVPNGNTANLYTPTPVPSDGQTFTMSPAAVGPAGGSQPHENRMTTLTVNYIIATDGIFPQQS